MVNTALVYQTRFQKTLHEANVHLARIDEALDELGKKYQFPIGNYSRPIEAAFPAKAI